LPQMAALKTSLLLALSTDYPTIEIADSLPVARCSA
jgi:hypothetical protein